MGANGEEIMKCGFKIGGGIDQDFKKSPQGYTDNVQLKIIISSISYIDLSSSQFLYERSY